MEPETSIHVPKPACPPAAMRRAMSAFYEGLADIFEVPPEQIRPGFDLVQHGWDSLAIISCLALIDDCFHRLVSGNELARCTTVADLEAVVAQPVLA